MVKILSRLLDSNEREIKKLQPLVAEIEVLEPEIQKLSDEGLRVKGKGLTRASGQTLGQGQTLDNLLPTAFAICREAIRRTVGERAFDVQLMAAIALHQGKIAEQKTGEGKTHAAALALYLNALSGQNCHLITVNDYLARRDAGWYGQALHFLGLSVGCICQEQKSYLYDPEYTDASQTDGRLAHLKPVSRREAYAAAVTYGTNNEFGFDYLRDNMVADPSQIVQRGHHFAIVDEVDFALIDEARTPLIISAPAEEAVEKYYDFARLASKLVNKTDYVIDEKAKSVNLTEIGIRKVERMLGVENLYEKDFATIHHIEAALKAKTLFQKDRDYVVKDGQVIIVDEFTGRLMFGRRYSEGLHQAIEAKENVPIQKESKTMATISFQNYFRMYEKLAGMTGTASTEAEEFAKIYGLDVVVIPTNEPMIRKDHSDVVYKTERAKFQAVVAEIEGCHRRGQPVLVGTTSIEKNELLGKLLARKKIPHEILNAKNHEKEAAIISQAGRLGAVTVATNMAGRGVDIKLGGDPAQADEYEKVKGLGGLHVIGTERHESRRIDNQLRGRSGRQGDPGSSRFFVSLQDDLMRIFGGEQVARLMDRLGVDENIPIEARLVSKSIENAQKKVEGHNFDVRKRLVEYDDVMNRQREIVYRLRRQILTPTSPTPPTAPLKPWLLEKISPYVENPDKQWSAKEKEIGAELFEKVVRQVALQTIDVLWIEHLDTLDDLRQGIGLRGYAAKDPLVEYKREAREMFERLMNEIWGSIAERISRVELRHAPHPPFPSQPSRLTYRRPEVELGVRQEAAEIQKPVVTGEKPGRNDPCPCGKINPKTGKPVKYKHCCYPKYG
jgi:preprotein translocase subunit SecA